MTHTQPGDIVRDLSGREMEVTKILPDFNRPVRCAWTAEVEGEERRFEADFPLAVLTRKGAI